MSIKNLKQIQQNFYQELKNATFGKKTSLPFILHEYSKPLPHTDNEVFQVITVGGSKFKKALIKIHGDKLQIISQHEKQQPIFKTGEDFFNFIKNEIDPFVEKIALNFAYPLKPIFRKNRLDGILQSGSKENEFSGLVGKKVGKTLETYFKHQKRYIQVAVANDTICLLLSGLDYAPWNSTAGGIVGTGVNFALFLNETSLVNLEAKDFNKFPLSEETKIIDRKSSYPKAALFEKETAGAYLYQHFNLLALKNNWNIAPLLSTHALKKLALSDTAFSKEADALIKKSASLVACAIGGITLFKNQDMVFVMEGSFFWEGEIYKNYVTYYLKHLVPQHLISFIKVDNSSVFGAVKLLF